MGAEKSGAPYPLLNTMNNIGFAKSITNPARKVRRNILINYLPMQQADIKNPRPKVRRGSSLTPMIF